jgi:hypothetical protein
LGPAPDTRAAPFGGLVTALLAGILLFAGCGGGDDQARWSGLRSVTIKVETPSIPEPEGSPGPTPKTFAKPGQLRRVTAALNDHDIRQVDEVEGEPGCSGGTEIAISIVEAGGGRTALHAYDCGDEISGDVGGDLTGFLAAVGAGR